MLPGVIAGILRRFVAEQSGNKLIDVVTMLVSFAEFASPGPVSETEAVFVST